MRFFLDNNLAPKLARGFREFVLGEHEVVHLRDRFSQETPDVEWMQQLADESGWVILSGDVAIGRNPHEVEAWKAAGHTIFFLKAGWTNIEFWQQVQKLARCVKPLNQPSAITPRRIACPHVLMGERSGFGWMLDPAQPSKRQGNFFEIITTSERARTKFLSRQMNSPSSRIVHNRLASQLLYRLLDWRKWDELKLAEVAGILPSVISAHLCGQRPIRPQHLAAYLRVLDRQERSALLEAWLQDNVNREAIANLLDGTKTDSMRSVEENRSRMLDWWATAIARDSKLAKIFRRFRSNAAKVPLDLLSLGSAAAVQFQGWLLEKACSLFTRVKQAGVALVSLVLALCQQGKVTQEAGQLAEQSGELAEKAIANSLFATSFVGPALAETTNFNFDLRDSSPPVNSGQGTRATRALVKGGLRRSQPQSQVAPAVRIQRTIGHEWRRLVTTRKNVHSAFSRLIRDAHPRQFKQTHRKQLRS